MAPIRVGFIGLSAKGSWAAGAHLPYLASTPRYTITALCTSSPDAAHASIAAHSLPSTTKVYASPAELAADKDIDLVVISIRVDKHYDAMLPVLKAGKDCYVEWPLASTHAQAKELVELARQSRSRVMVGLQNQQVPTMQKLKQLVASGRLGRLLAVGVVGNGLIGGPAISKSIEYTTSIPVGATMINIAGGHCRFSPPLFPLVQVSQ
jgi:predicted dehydrogenase